jgi:diaminopimelate epimerase
MHFWKYSGAGNDFILLDDREHTLPIDSKQWIMQLCHRRLCIGADGLIILRRSSKADFQMRIFNADGGEASMCGNGLRCLANFLRELGEKKDLYTIETMYDKHTVSYRDDAVMTTMSLPKDISLQQEIYGYTTDILNTGVPHAVIFVDDVDAINLKTIGKKIRHHERFLPEGVNVDFAEICFNNKIKMRTYERGVEHETLACGTGAVAVAMAASYNKKIEFPVDIITRSQDILKVYKDCSILGPARLIYRGFLCSS